MINPRNVMDILANLISERLTLTPTPPSTKRDDEVAQMLFENVESILDCTSYSFENDDTLDLDRDTALIEEEITSDDNDDDVSDDLDDEDYDDEGEKKNTLPHQFSFEYMHNVVEFFDERDRITGKRKHSFSNVQRHFKRVKDRNYIRRFRKYLESQGTARQKLDKIDSSVYKSFENARNKFLSVHDIDLRRWALKTAAELSHSTFVASDHWIYEFKKRHNIVSRKITKLVTKREIHNKDMINKSAEDFVTTVQKIALNYPEHRVLNTDQSGLQLEIFSNRTLSYQGEKLTLATVRSINNTTHSYTVQPTITMSGALVGPLFLCLKEESGRLSERVKLTLFKPSSIVLTCSKSGKLTSSLVEYWRDEVLTHIVGNEKYLLISDCWGAQGARKIYDELPNIRRLEIPKKTTSMIQPLDVYFNRQYKVIARRLSDHIRLYELDINLAHRNNIIKMNSLIFNQLSSRVFTRMIQYAWFRSGYLTTDPGSFQNVKEVCFTFTDYSCSVDNCNEMIFIQCSWCERLLCIYHFFTDYHFHE
jgi:Tc5 transposase C-terminal domain/Tc5 transposase DNA-binding domain/DDE superfamily endonuclease